MFPKPTSLRLKGKKLQELRIAVWERDEGRCVHCNKPVMYSSDNLLRKMDLSHIIHHSRGGSDTIENTRTACHQCHLREHNGGKPCPSKS